MKKIEAIVRPEKLSEIRAQLEKESYPGITISEVQGHGKQKGITQQWRGSEYKVDLVPKVKLELYVLDEDVERIVNVIMRAAKTGNVGDGKIFIIPVEDAVRVRTGEGGDNAI